MKRTGASAMAVTRGEESEPVSGEVAIGVACGEDERKSARSDAVVEAATAL